LAFFVVLLLSQQEPLVVGSLMTPKLQRKSPLSINICI